MFVMHDLLNDLAKDVAGDFFIRLDSVAQKNIKGEMLEGYRHMSFVREEYVPYKKFEALKRARGLRTFLATSFGLEESWPFFYFSNKILEDLLPELPLLRVLSLSNFRISEVPESIGHLRHLRYLNLSQTSITHLPENVCNLYNLQTLILFDCTKLTKLPSSFLKLKNLRHLDIKKTPLLHQMPLEIDELKSLQTLSKIIIGGEGGFEIAKLKDFKNLCGKVSIEGLDKVEHATHAHDAQLSQKSFIELKLVWNDELHDSSNEMLEKDVLNELKPYNEHLEKLKIVSYGGLEFPNWIGDPLFLQLKHVSIQDCRRCTSLPPLGQLPLLKELLIEGLYGVEVVGLELLGTGGAFVSLEILSFKDMRGWKKWSANTAEVFPRLKNLVIKDCHNLVEVTFGALPSLNALDMRGCDSCALRRLVEVAASVTELDISDISGLNDVVWRGVVEHLRSVEELRIWYCNELSYLWESDASASKVLVKLRKLEVDRCDNLVSLGEKEEEGYCQSDLLTSLRMLDVSNCKNMVQCSFPDCIEMLRVWNCTSITAMSLST